jgi:hypothetical protein
MKSAITKPIRYSTLFPRFYSSESTLRLPQSENTNRRMICNYAEGAA